MRRLARSATIDKAMKAPVAPERLAGKRVTHVTFGKGRISRVEDNYIVVAFGKVERKFEYPEAFRHYLTADDKKLRALLPECEPMPVREKPAVPAKKKDSGFVRDEYDTFILADMVHCTI